MPSWSALARCARRAVAFGLRCASACGWRACGGWCTDTRRRLEGWSGCRAWSGTRCWWLFQRACVLAGHGGGPTRGDETPAAHGTLRSPPASRQHPPAAGEFNLRPYALRNLPWSLRASTIPAAKSCIRRSRSHPAEVDGSRGEILQQLRLGRIGMCAAR